MKGPWTVYRHYDDAGALLYVGMSMRPDRRTKDHRRSAAWWPQLATIKLEHYQSEIEAQLAEQDAIRAEAPRHNAAKLLEDAVERMRAAVAVLTTKEAD